MPIPESHIKERLSVAYVKTVTAKAGAQYATPNGQEYGLDGFINRVTDLTDGGHSNTGWNFQCQIKSTVNWNLKNDHIIYDMDATAYNKLANWTGNSPCILILFRLPQNIDEWLRLDEESLILKNCCYWKHITDPPTENTSTIRVELPRNQLFTPEAVEGLFIYMENNQGTLP